MKTLQTKHKIVISYGLVSIIFVAGAMVSFVPLLTGTNYDHNVVPKIGMPTPNAQVPNIIAPPSDSSVVKGMPVPGSNVAEMIIKPE